MTGEKFIKTIENNSLHMATRWAEGMLQSDYAKTYRQLSKDKLIGMSKNVYDNLGKWLDHENSVQETGRIYAEIGRQRYQQGYPLCEIIFALHYTKKMLAETISTEGLLPDAMNLYHTFHFMVHIYNFFDFAAFYLVRGYQEALFRRMAEFKKMKNEDINQLFPPGSFYYQAESRVAGMEKWLAGFNVFKIR